MQLHVDISVCLTISEQPALRVSTILRCSTVQNASVTGLTHGLSGSKIWRKMKGWIWINVHQCTSMMINVHNFLALWTLFITRDSPGTPTFSAVQPGWKREAQRRHFRCCITFKRCEIKTNNSNTLQSLESCQVCQMMSFCMSRCFKSWQYMWLRGSSVGDQTWMQHHPNPEW